MAKDSSEEISPHMVGYQGETLTGVRSETEISNLIFEPSVYAHVKYMGMDAGRLV